MISLRRRYRTVIELLKQFLLQIRQYLHTILEFRTSRKLIWWDLKLKWHSLLTVHYWLTGMIFLTKWGRDKMNVISQTIFSSTFTSMKMLEFRLKFHWSFFRRVQITIFQHWVREWLGADQAISHCLNQWWHRKLTHIYVNWPQWIKPLAFYCICHLWK